MNPRLVMMLSLVKPHPGRRCVHLTLVLERAAARGVPRYETLTPIPPAPQARPASSRKTNRGRLPGSGGELRRYLRHVTALRARDRQIVFGHRAALAVRAGEG